MKKKDRGITVLDDLREMRLKEYEATKRDFEFRMKSLQELSDKLHRNRENRVSRVKPEGAIEDS